MAIRDVRCAAVTGGDRLLRHRRDTRWIHGIHALIIAVLVASGWALAGVIPESWLPAAVGHLAVNELHRWLGVATVAGLILLSAAFAGRVARLVGAVFTVSRGDILWYPRFVRYLVRPTKWRPPLHAGRFDPGQRVVFAVILVALAVVCATGTGLFFSPPLPFAWMGWLIILHVVASWTLIVAVGVHIFAGVGVLRTHRRLYRCMFGDGKVDRSQAKTLWPAWAGRAGRKRKG